MLPDLQQMETGSKPMKKNSMMGIHMAAILPVAERLDATAQALEPASPKRPVITSYSIHYTKLYETVALDLEQYDYRAGADTLIRATEGTILDRLPPRIRVRERAHIELPHIMVLIDDPGRTVIEPLSERA